MRFFGKTKFAKGEGVWVGIEYDEPMGKNDGSSVTFLFPSQSIAKEYLPPSIQSERYFTCRPNYGVFVRPEKVQIGDFPVEEIDLDDEEM